MIDFIKLQTKLEPEGAERLRERMAAAGCAFEIVINGATGQIVPRTKERAQWGGYVITLRPFEVDGYCLHYRAFLEGSLHKGFHSGKNFEPFHFAQLIHEINRLECELQLPADCWKIDNIEVGVNITPPFAGSPARFIDTHLLMHGAKEVRHYKEYNRKQIGKHSFGEEAFLKCYDKGFQYDLPFPLMRVELHLDKMRPLKCYGVQHLSDLRKLSILEALLAPLRAAWDKVLLTEPLSTTAAALLAKRGPAAVTLWEFGQHIRNWKELQQHDPKTFERRRRQWHRIRIAIGCTMREQISTLIAAEWHRLATVTPTSAENAENTMCTFFPTRIKGEKGTPPTGGPLENLHPSALITTYAGTPTADERALVQNLTKPDIEKGTAAGKAPPGLLIKVDIQKTISGNEAPLPPRRCLTCGRDISEQKDGAKYCSAKIAGERGAHQCRNTRSNLLQRLAALDRNEGGFLFDCAPFVVVPVFPHHFAGTG